MNSRSAMADQILREALELPQEQRAAFLDDACRGDAELRLAVSSQLAEIDRQNGIASDPTSQATPRATVGATQAAGTAAPGLQPAPGATLAGRYRIERILGAGGMGVVYCALDQKLDRPVAIKMLPAGVLAGEEARIRFRREARALAKLNHAHIAGLYDVIEADGADFIVLELVPGVSLAARIGSGRMGVREATAIALQAAEALGEAHEQGIIHRDYKPANVMLTPKGQVKVLDFGLAKLLDPAEAALSLTQPRGVLGTPLYMSPEQAQGKPVDARTDLWSLGVVYYELLTGRAPFAGDSWLAVLRAITRDAARPVRALRPDAPALAERIVARAMAKEPEMRYACAADMAVDLSRLLVSLSGTVPAAEARRSRLALQGVAAGLGLCLLAAALGGLWFYRRLTELRWAREEAAPRIAALMQARRTVPAFGVLERAEADLPGDAGLKKLASADTQWVRVTSDPPGANVSIQDYMTPEGPRLSLGTTPLRAVRIPAGYFRWTVSRAGVGTMVLAPQSDASMHFDLARAGAAPPGMVYAAAGSFSEFNAFIGWIGPYRLPAYYMDRDEVTNREYQDFVDRGGYENPKFWPATFIRQGKTIAWAQAMRELRDSTGRAGPSTWAGGHYRPGTADDPVSGVSWFEAAAFAQFVGKQLPVVGQWYRAADFDAAAYTSPLSNLRGRGLMPAGKSAGLGPYGTDDMAGNVREWIANPVDGDLRFILGGSWRSPTYLYTSPEALSPYDRSDTNGFRCVRNLAPLPAQAAAEVHRIGRDFTHSQPVSPAVFDAYTLLYAYAKTPLNAKSEGMVRETEDWREEKVAFDAAYGGQRMSAYLFLPKRVKPPYQTVLFFPSARVMFLPPGSSELGDVNYFDYVIQSGRAVLYPVYNGTYDRQDSRKLPDGGSRLAGTVEWYQDAARSLDYLQTRPDIDHDKLAYLGVSMGSAYGVIYAALLQQRLRTAVFLDGGYFLSKAQPGGDQADFAPRMRKPVLMVNGRYDYTFPVETAQDPLFRMLGTPAADKRHVVLDTPHDVTQQRPELVQAVLEWLDKYLGRVGG